MVRGMGGAPHVLVPVLGATGWAGGADMCLARWEGSEGLVCPADTSMTTRSSLWGGQHSSTCLGCTPCELAPPSSIPRSGSCLCGPGALASTPGDPTCGSSESLSWDTAHMAARDRPESVGHRLHLHTGPQPHPGGRRWAPGPLAWAQAQGSSGLGSTRPAGLLSHTGRMAPGLGCTVRRVPAVTLGETCCPAPGSSLCSQNFPRSTQATALKRGRSHGPHLGQAGWS